MSLSFYRDGIILWPNFDNDMGSICVGPSWVIWKIFVRAQNNLWGLYRKYLWQPKLGNYMGNICESANWVICGKYLGNM